MRDPGPAQPGRVEPSPCPPTSWAPLPPVLDKGDGGGGLPHLSEDSGGSGLSRTSGPDALLLNSPSPPHLGPKPPGPPRTPTKPLCVPATSTWHRQTLLVSALGSLLGLWPLPAQPSGSLGPGALRWTDRTTVSGDRLRGQDPHCLNTVCILGGRSFLSDLFFGLIQKLSLAPDFLSW